MKVLIVTTSRADWNGLGMVCRELIRREIGVSVAAYTKNHGIVDWHSAISEDVQLFDYGSEVVERQCVEYQPDVAVVAGDRSELLEACITLCKYKVPICHIGGGDITEGSMDNRYRDAITALACIHCVETEDAEIRLRPRNAALRGLIQCGTDDVVLTGQPGLDRIKQTTPEQPEFWFKFRSYHKPVVLLLVHPNTTHKQAMLECDAIIEALRGFDGRVIPLECNGDPGWDLVDGALIEHFGALVRNLPPAQFYWLLQHCDVLVGNSSAGTAEAPCFGIPVVNVGDRQKGREFGPNTWHVSFEALTPHNIRICIEAALKRGRGGNWRSPYGDGGSAPRIVKALEDNAWRWNGGVDTSDIPEADEEFFKKARLRP